MLVLVVRVPGFRWLLQLIPLRRLRQAGRRQLLRRWLIEYRRVGVARTRYTQLAGMPLQSAPAQHDPSTTEIDPRVRQRSARPRRFSPTPSSSRASIEENPGLAVVNEFTELRCITVRPSTDHAFPVLGLRRPSPSAAARLVCGTRPMSFWLPSGLIPEQVKQRCASIYGESESGLATTNVSRSTASMMSLSPTLAPVVQRAVHRSPSSCTRPSGRQAETTVTGSPIMASRPTATGMRRVKRIQYSFFVISQATTETTSVRPHGSGTTTAASRNDAAINNTSTSVEVPPRHASSSQAGCSPLSAFCSAETSGRCRHLPVSEAAGG